MTAVINHLWQSTVFAGLAAVLTLALRRNGAAVRYWVWFSASLKFLVPLAVLIGAGSRVAWRPASPAMAAVVVQAAEPFAMVAPLPAAPAAAAPREWLPAILLGLWACGVAGVAAMRRRAWLQVRATLRASRPIELAAPIPVRVSPGLLEPGVAGWRRPVLLLPEGIAERLTGAQLAAVLAHEACHVRRRDNLLSAVPMVVEALFWFHPLVWWLSARLVEERERACDEEVLRQGSEAQVYAEGILAVCKAYVESPLACVAGVTGANLKRRLEAILQHRAAARLNLAQKLMLAAAGMAALGAPLWVGMLHAPAARAQGEKFEVASVKLVQSCGDTGTGYRGGGKTKGGGGGAAHSPDRLRSCGTLEQLIHEAYVVYANGFANVSGARLNRLPVEGGAEWVRADKYMIDAKAEGAPGEGALYGAMLRGLLEERFRLKLRREARMVPAYAMTAVGGKAKAPAFRADTCWNYDPNLPVAPPGPGSHPCMFGFRNGKIAGEMTVDAQGTSYGNLARLLALALGRPVIDKTGIAGLFDFHAEFRPDEETPFFDKKEEASEPGPSLLVALREQLGLRLEPAQGSRAFLVIERVERPAEN